MQGVKWNMKHHSDHMWVSAHFKQKELNFRYFYNPYIIIKDISCIRKLYYQPSLKVLNSAEVLDIS